MKSKFNQEDGQMNNHDIGDEEHGVPKLESWSLTDFPDVFDAFGNITPGESCNEFSVYPRG